MSVDLILPFIGYLNYNITDDYEDPDVLIASRQVSQAEAITRTNTPYKSPNRGFVFVSVETIEHSLFIHPQPHIRELLAQ